MDPRFDAFLDLSTELTGFNRVELRGTGVAERLLGAFGDVLPEGVVDELLDDGRGAETLLADPKLGPVARHVVLAWYTGTWTALPDAWRATYGAAPGDTTHVLFPEAYVAGLQWRAAGAHPEGALQQGYGSWAVPPGQTGALVALTAAIPR